MIIFDKDKYLKDIKENGIGATDQCAKQKIRYVIEDFILNSSYRKNKIVEKVKEIAREYFTGLPDEIVSSEIETMYDESKAVVCDDEARSEHNTKTIHLYVSEMETIAKIKDEQLMRLAFATLILHKYCGQFSVNGVEKYHPSVRNCDADIYRVAELNDVSGTKKNKMWKQLADMGLVKFYVKTNTAFKFNPEWIAMTLFTVPFNVDLKEDKTGEEIYMDVTNYDDLMIYLKHYKGQRNLIRCTDCGTPIERTGNSKCLCVKCAAERKRQSDRARYSRKLAFA